MFSIEAYIKQEVRNPKYSIVKWITAKNTALNTYVATIDETRNTPKLIWCNELYLHYVSGTGLGFTFKDSMGTLILNIPAGGSQTGDIKPMKQFFHLFKSNKVTFTSVGSVEGFSIAYQYIYE